MLVEAGLLDLANIIVHWSQNDGKSVLALAVSVLVARAGGYVSEVGGLMATRDPELDVLKMQLLVATGELHQVALILLPPVAASEYLMARAVAGGDANMAVRHLRSVRQT